MAEITKEYFMKNWMTLANFLILITFVTNQARWQQSIDSSITHFHEHVEDTNSHMPLSQKIEVFVPRVELDIRLENMENLLEKIENKLDKE